MLGMIIKSSCRSMDEQLTSVQEEKVDKKVWFSPQELYRACYRRYVEGHMSVTPRRYTPEQEQKITDMLIAREKANSLPHETLYEACVRRYVEGRVLVSNSKSSEYECSKEEEERAVERMKKWTYEQRTLDEERVIRRLVVSMGL